MQSRYDNIFPVDELKPKSIHVMIYCCHPGKIRNWILFGFPGWKNHSVLLSFVTDLRAPLGFRTSMWKIDYFSLLLFISIILDLFIISLIWFQNIYFFMLICIFCIPARMFLFLIHSLYNNLFLTTYHQAHLCLFHIMIIQCYLFTFYRWFRSHWLF